MVIWRKPAHMLGVDVVPAVRLKDEAIYSDAIYLQDFCALVYASIGGPRVNVNV